MNLKTIFGAFFVIAAPAALADNHASDKAQWSAGAPLEIYGCSFKDGIDG